MKYPGVAVAAGLLLIVVIGYSRLLTSTPRHPTSVVPTKTSAVAASTLESPEDPVFPVTVTDAGGEQITLTRPPERIVSLAPSVTELVFDLGDGDRLVGDTTACDWPPKAASVPHIGGAFDMSIESIAARNPDLIIADGTINQQIVRTLRSAGYRVLMIAPKNLESSYSAIRIIGLATGETRASANMINEMKVRFDKVRKSVSGALTSRRVLVLWDVSKLYTSGPGTLIDDMIRIAGGQNVAKSNDPLVSENVIQDQPDVIICSHDLEKSIEQMPGWKGVVPAVTNTAFFQPSSDATLIRPCLRLVKGAEELARALHPELFLSNGTPSALHETPAGGAE